ncbi:simple sugar transport system substrate-binding protein [Deinococcus metalli]|uniref:ABC transporter substrate-binding protein n=1 Tax=Deinococcus metalli TaxID=1141878 RepID=A0A7W8KEZ6_9DEIO|nr:BMP family ABC transporter substrate-binding protein [Deinococcus metalli]MBB5375893.1 simple sugar transport system substrate-binding protein [Deinococcus metalli]GHF36255.1 ABC transporter substrate-binding protein [Deinococcus metalli]
MKRPLLATLTLLSTTMTLAPTAQAQAGGKLKACFVYTGPVGDGGWTYAHEQGRLITQKALPWLDSSTVESVPEGQAMPVLDKLVARGCQVIFTTSYGYMDDTLAAAKKYPNVIFAHNAGYKRAPNMATYMADFYQVFYVNGLIAGALTKTGKVGFLGTFPIPELKRHLDGFALGVRAANPKANVNVTWINSWFDPTKAREAAEALISGGADVLTSSEDSATGLQTIASKKLPGFSHYNSMIKYAPDYTVSGQLVHWDKIYIDFLTKVHSGTYTTKNLQNVDYWWLLNKGAVEVGADYGMVVNPKWTAQLKAATMTVNGKKMSVYDRVTQVLADMSKPTPTFDPFTGPIKDRNGVLRVPAGKTVSVADLNTLSWVVPGVVGQVADEPKK